MDLLKIRLHQFQRAFICIDATDELDPRVLKKLLEVLKDLVSNDIRLFLTGRDHIESEIQNRLQVAQRYRATITASHQDIQKFVEQQIEDDLYPEAMNKGLEKDILSAVIEKSQGM